MSSKGELSSARLGSVCQKSVVMVRLRVGSRPKTMDETGSIWRQGFSKAPLPSLGSCASLWVVQKWSFQLASPPWGWTRAAHIYTL